MQMAGFYMKRISTKMYFRKQFLIILLYIPLNIITLNFNKYKKYVTTSLSKSRSNIKQSKAEQSVHIPFENVSQLLVVVVYTKNT